MFFRSLPWSGWPVWIRAWLIVLAAVGVSARFSIGSPGEGVRGRLGELGPEIDPRRMCARELRQLPGVGERLALAIAGARDAHGAPEKSAEPGELLWEDVPGIGELRARAIRGWLAERGVEPDPLAGERPGGGAAGRYPGAVPPSAASVLTALLALAASCGGASTGPDPAGARAATPRGAQPAAGIRRRVLALESGPVNALEAGPPSARAVLLLHGGRFRAATWEDLGTLEKLAGAGFRALAIDWPGFGDSPAPQRETPAGEVLADVLESSGIEQALIVAPSLGGSFAFDLIERDAQRVAGFVPIAPAGIEDFQPPAGLRLPALVLWGGADEQLPVGRAAFLAEKLHGARVEILSGASHPCYLDAPERFHELLLAFAREVIGDAH